MARCGWTGENPRLIEYHDGEWGVPVHDDRKHFEFLALDAFQAGLSWALILGRREGFRAAFDDFDPERIARFGPKDVERLLRDARIVRNRQKIEATISNALAFLELREEAGSFDAFIWTFTGGATLQNRWGRAKDVPAQTPQSRAMSRALKERGFRFVGPTICYAYMQAAGMVNDHVISCFRHPQVAALARR